MTNKFDIHFEANIITRSVSKVSIRTEYDDAEEFMRNHRDELIQFVTGKIKKKNNVIDKVVIVRITDHKPGKSNAMKRLKKLTH